MTHSKNTIKFTRNQLITILLVIIQSTAFGQKDQLQIFPIHFYNDTMAAMPIGNIYPYSEHPDSSIFSSQNLMMSQVQRDIFFSRMKFNRNDSLFIMDLENDRVVSYCVMDIELASFPNPYFDQDNQDLSEYDIQIELRWKELNINEGESNCHHCIAMIAQGNPFISRRVKPLIWNDHDTTDLPQYFQPDDSTHQYWNFFTLGAAYKFHYDTYTYWMAVDRADFYSRARIIVIDDSSQQKVLDQYIQSSEGINLFPFARTSGNNQQIYQWTGKIFKDYPVMIYGFESYTFWCTRMFLFNSNPIHLKCDNRY